MTVYFVQRVYKESNNLLYPRNVLRAYQFYQNVDGVVST
jgi:hypothetical protein